MPKFSLQRVLELKERREQAVAVQLAEARAAAEAARRAQLEIEEARRAGDSRPHPVSGGPVPVGQIQNATYLMSRVEERLDEARAAVRSADASVDLCLADFTVASQERQVLDRLKDRKLEAAAVARTQVDRKVMDEIALARYVRSPKSSGSVNR